MARVLVIEDDEATAREIVLELSNRGFEVTSAPDGREGLLKAATGGYDAITLDRMLPNLDGLALVGLLRGAGVETPVLMISALSDVDERVRGLRAGGDDYLTKPFASEELAARLEVLLRRKGGGAAMETRLKVGDLELDVVARTARRAGREIALLPTEYRLLELMMRHAGQVLTRTMIFEAVWGYHFDPRTNLIEVHVGRLRKKIELPGEGAMIRTVRGSGYCLRAPD